MRKVLLHKHDKIGSKKCVKKKKVNTQDNLVLLIQNGGKCKNNYNKKKQNSLNVSPKTLLI